MPDLATTLSRLQAEFAVTDDMLYMMADVFRREMAAGLAGHPRSLAMLPSYLHRPSGQEHGVFLALDFGGTNVRALAVKLHGDGRLTVPESRKVPLADTVASYDYTWDGADADQLFDFLAAQLGKIAPPAQTLLGHTFSFPCDQLDVNNAILLHWTKEIKTPGVEGRNIVDLLNIALRKAGLRNIRPVAILNDTVSTLLAAAYSDNNTDIGSICGTGHNTCYLELKPPGSIQPMYINIEAGNFDKAPGNNYDFRLDRASEKPGIGRLEKMCAGRYLGEIFRLGAQELTDSGLFSGQPVLFLAQPDAVDTQDLALFLADATPNLDSVKAWLETRQCPSTIKDRLALRHLAQCIVERSARFVATTYSAIVGHIDPELTRPHTIAVDGSLYEKMPGYARIIEDTLAALLGEKVSRIKVRLHKDGSGTGAAVAAAIVANPIESD